MPDSQQGSPPLVRERLRCQKATGKTVRITPARAGKTQPVTIWMNWGQDHPRSCGKDNGFEITYLTYLGSPPLVRERPIHSNGAAQAYRITPARAGKTTSVPLACPFAAGSPPLVRERQDKNADKVAAARITPARAGKTSALSQTDIDTWDHPRSCGKDSNGSLYLRHFAFAGI